LIEQAQALGEPPEDPLLLFSVLYGSFGANLLAFNGAVARDLATECLTLAEKQGAKVPLMIGHRLMGTVLLYSGNIMESRAHLDRAIALYDPAEHRALATRFGGIDTGATVLSTRSNVLWILGYPEVALADAEQALRTAREIDQAATLMNALAVTLWTLVLCQNYEAARLQCDELFSRADQKGAGQWKAAGILGGGAISALTGKPTDAVQAITSGLAASKLTGATLFVPYWSSCLARAYAETGHFDDAWRSINEAITTVETTKERWYEAEVHRIAGEIALTVSRRRPIRRRRNPISSVPSPLHVRSKQSRGNSAQL
jgi:predicted ATPase